MTKKATPFFLISLGFTLLITILLSGCGGGGSGSLAVEDGVTAIFTSTVETGNAPLNIYFDASGSSSPYGDIDVYSWDFGDGTTNEGPSHTHTYRSQGKYYAALTVTDTAGNQHTTVKTIVVTTPPESIVLSGSVIIGSGSDADTDTNDLNAVHINNNSFETAQRIASPVTLGGYVNEQLKGEAGQSYALGDRSDFFRVYLTGDETISLSFPDAPSTDLDLYLYNGDFEIVDSSKNFFGLETITPNGQGNFYIRVFAFNGSSNYVLTIGQTLATATAMNMRLETDFVPGEAVVFLKEHGNAKTGNPALLSSLNAPAPLLMKLETDPRALSGNPNTMEHIHRKTAELIPGASKNLFAKDRTLNIIKMLAKRDDILWVEPNYIRKACATQPSDPHYPIQWHYPLITLPEAWDLSTGSPDVITAVIDTGVLTDHPDLAGQLTPGYDFISNIQNARDGGGIDSNPDDPGDLIDGTSSSFHGTHIAGTIGALSDNGLGIAGIAWQSKIMPVRALGALGGTTYDIIQSLRFAAGLSNDSGSVPEKPAAIINMSYGGTGYSHAEKNIISTLNSMGIIMVAAAGNESTSQFSYPAAYPDVISVSSLTIEKQPAWYTNFGPWVDIAAPGGDNSRDLNGDGHKDAVFSTAGDDSEGSIKLVYNLKQGTSMSAAHVSGVLALMKSIYPDLDYDQFTSLLSMNKLTDDTGEAGRDDFHGYGLINAKKCLTAAKELALGIEITDDPRLAVTPESLNFGAYDTHLTLTTINTGEGQLFLNPPVSDSPWLSIVPETIDSNNLGSYTVIADRAELFTNTAYSGTLTFTASANSIQVQVSLYQTETATTTSDLGLHYIQLVNTETGEITQTSIQALAGEYPFTFTDIKPGIYKLFAGNDPDFDGSILGSWEAAGGYQTLESPSLIYANQDLSGLEFYTGYSLTISAGISAGPLLPAKTE